MSSALGRRSLRRSWLLALGLAASACSGLIEPSGAPKGGASDVRTGGLLAGGSGGGRLMSGLRGRHADYERLDSSLRMRRMLT